MSQIVRRSLIAVWQRKLIQYLEMIRFSHTIFALPFALLATTWAYVVPIPTYATANPYVEGGPAIAAEKVASSEHLHFHWTSLLGIVLCMVFARSFAMAMNRLLDERFDAANPRTANRHLPSKALTRQGVVGFCVVCGIGFLLSCLLFLPNVLPILLSVPVLFFLAGYSLAKRFTNLVHFWLGIALMLAPICAWIALRGEVVLSNPSDLLPACWLGLVVFLWVSGFDIIYACQDEQFDRSAGLFSIPAKLGVRNALRVAALCHAMMWLVAVGMSVYLPILSLGWLFRFALILIGLCLLFEHAVVSEKSLARIQLAFFQLNSVISLVFLVVGTIDATWR